MSETTYSTKKRHQSMGPATVMVQKTPAGTSRMSYGGAGGNVISRQSVSRSYTSRGGGGGSLALKAGTASRASKESVDTVMLNRGKEKEELTNLNDRFARYIEKVKFLEANNKILVDELEKLRKMKGYTQDRVKEIYEEELQDARDTIKELSMKISPLESKIVALQDECDTKDLEIEDLTKQREEWLNKVDQVNHMCADLEGEVGLLRKNMDSMQHENTRLRGEVENLRNDNMRVKDDCEEAVTAQLDAANRAEALQEELDFIIKSTNLEIEELRELLAAHKTNLPKMQETWAGEFKNAISQLKQEYDAQLDRITDETRRSYDDQLMRIKTNLNKDETDAAMIKTEVKNLKSQLHDKKGRHGDLEAENERLRNQLRELQLEYDRECDDCCEEKRQLNVRIIDLESDVNAVLEEMDILKDKKLGLELEITTYRKLLDCEEKSMERLVQGRVQSRGAADLAGVISGSQQSKQPEKSGKTRRPGTSKAAAMSESTGMVRVTRASKCNVSIAETAQDGSYIKLENTSNSKDFDLSNFTLERTHPKGTSEYKFDKFILAKGKTIKIYGHAFEDVMDPGSLVGNKGNCRTWGVGNGNVCLKCDKKTDKATSCIAYN